MSGHNDDAAGKRDDCGDDVEEESAASKRGILGSNC